MQQPAASIDRSQQIALARAALARKDNRAAISLLEQASAAFPQDAEILRLLGNAYAFSERYDAAIATLRHAQGLAPNDMDVQAALARAYLWSGDRQSAERELIAIEQRAPGSADAVDIRNRLIASIGERAGTSPMFGVAVTQSVSRVSFPSRPGLTWATTSFAVFGTVHPGTTISLGADHEDRQFAIDTRLEARVDQRLGAHMRSFVALAATPHAYFRERWSISGGVEADVTSFATLIADLRHAEYQDASVTVFQPGVRLTSRRIATDLTVRMINLWDEQSVHRTGISGRIDHRLPGGALLYAGAATYPDTEAGITRQMRSLVAGGSVPLSQKLLFRAGLDYDKRSASYHRKGASIGLQVRF